MNELEKEFAPYQESLELKELGFDEPCFAYYDLNGLQVITHHWYPQNKNSSFPLPHTTNNPKISAPTFSQAFSWFREKQGLHGIYTMGDDWNNYYWQVWRNDAMTKTYVCSSDWVYETYEEAELACLRKLIEIVKTK